MNVGQLIGEVCRLERAEADEVRERANRDTTKFAISRHGYRIMTPALSRWRGVESKPGVERLLAVCRDEFGDAKCETLKRLRDRLSIHLDCEPAVVSAMSLEEFLSAWKGDAKLHGKPDKPDLKPDKPERKRRRRPMNAEAADCARLFKKAKRSDPTTKMTHIVAEYAEKHRSSAESIMRILNDNPDQWKTERRQKDDQNTTP